jgi:hypothetical protein
MIVRTHRERGAHVMARFYLSLSWRHFFVRKKPALLPPDNGALSWVRPIHVRMGGIVAQKGFHLEVKKEKK